MRSELVEIEGSFGLRCVRILFGLFEQLVELSLQNLVVALVVCKRLFECLGSPCFFAFELLDCRANVLNDRWFLVLLVAYNRLQIGVDLKGRFTTGAADLNQLTFAFRHYANVSATGA